MARRSGGRGHDHRRAGRSGRGRAAGGLLHSLRSRFHDIGIDDKFMKQVAKEIEKGKSALFVQYTGTWAASIGLVEQAIQAESPADHEHPARRGAGRVRALVELAAE